MRSGTDDKRHTKLERVLDVASELFAASDFQRVCMQDIALRAGVGKGTLYNLFDSKEDLYFSIIKNRLAELLDLLERAYDCRRDTLKNLRSLILHLHKFMSKYPHFYLIWKREENALAQKDRLGIGELQRRIAGLVHKTLEAGTEEGVLRPGLDHEILTHLLLGMTDGLRKSPMNVPLREKSIDDLLDVLIRGIGVDASETRVTYDEYRHVRSGDVG